MGRSVSLSATFPSHGRTGQLNWSIFEEFAKPRAPGGGLIGQAHLHLSCNSYPNVASGPRQAWSLKAGHLYQFLPLPDSMLQMGNRT